MSTAAVIGAPPAPLGRRILAVVIDGVGTSLCALPIWLSALLSGLGTNGTGARPTLALLPTLIGGALLLVWGIVQWVLHGTQGWTIGRRLVGLRVVDVLTGRPIGMGRALIRGLIVSLGTLACGVGQWVVYASVFWDPSGRRRGWHDRVAEAIVVDVWARPASARLDQHRVGVDDRTGLAAESAGSPVASAPQGAPDAGQPFGTVPGAPSGPDTTRATGGPSAAAPELGTLSSSPEFSPLSGAVPTVAPRPGDPPVPEHTRWAGMIASGQPVQGPELVLPPLPASERPTDRDTRAIPLGDRLPGWVNGAPGAEPVNPPHSDAPVAARTEPLPPASPVTSGGPSQPGAPVAPGTPVPSGTPVAPEASLPPGGPSQPRLPLPPSRASVSQATAGGAMHDTTQLPPVPADPRPVPGTPGHAPQTPRDAVVPPMDSFWSDPAATSGPSSQSGAGQGLADLLGPAPSLAGSPAVTTPEGRPPQPGEVAASRRPGESRDASSAGRQDSASGPERQPGPAGWAARLPDGTLVDLDGGPVLIGRNPAPLVGLRAVAVQDPGMSVSKTHLVLGADVAGAWVMDRGSTNGTLVTLPDGQRIVCLPDQRVRVAPGSVVFFGDLSLTIGQRGAEDLPG
ncbi:RDD family protein [Cellulomonas sp. NPDC089187]|uniref:RDD family protein n=1 Tax=Cellulomonas sp. NPDC089187 TaxID=3154970 RepID=UPI00344583A1